MRGHELKTHSLEIIVYIVCVFIMGPAASLHAQQFVRFDKAWWASLDKNARWDFIYGYSDCGAPFRSGLNMQQYEDFVDDHVTSAPDSVPSLIRLAPHRIKALKPLPGGEVWTEKHGFNDGDLWGDNADEGRAWVEGYMACENRHVTIVAADHYVYLLLKHYANPKRHLDKLADALEPLLPPKSSGGQQ